ncbi:uncharacterized protein TNCV_1619031 [Trichonephila clavipes]|nr:uncharacterized protein TNCV_1619031 [Trichonephila clavipes]
MNLEDIPSLYWTDSSTALYWIQHEDHWGTFVNNRVEEIRNLSSKEAWKHLPGTCNPADLPSSGCSVQRFLKSRWWEGPQWLKLPEKDWPVTVSQCNLEEILKERKKGIVSLINSVNLDKKWLKTKITRRDAAENFISPLVLPPDHPLIERLIFERHLQSSHARTQVVLTDIRQKFWLLRGRKTVQRVISKCTRCKRYAAKIIESIPTPLPEGRVREALATINSGPLNSLSEDPNDSTPLTPSMFIQETRTVGVPDLDNLHKINISKRYQYQQALRNNSWKRFRDEYLSMLVQRPNRSEARQVKLGGIVIVESD